MRRLGLILLGCLAVGALATTARADVRGVRMIQGGLAAIDLDTSAELRTLLTDETGTGIAVFADSPVFVDDFNLAAAGVKFAGATGVLTMTGLSGQAEDLKLDFAGSANRVVFATTTGVNVLDFSGMTGLTHVLPYAGSLGWGAVGALAITEASNVMQFYDHSGNLRQTISSAGIDIGAACASTHSQGSNDACAADQMEVIGKTYADGGLAVGAGSTITVDGATTFAVTSSYHVLACTGNETINTITGGVVGMVLYIENTDTECSIADDDTAVAANAIDLTGTATADVGAVDKVLVLIYVIGGWWEEVGESDN